MAKVAISGLVRRLIQKGLVEESQAVASLEAAAMDQSAPIARLVKDSGLNETDVALLAAAEYGEPLLDLEAFDIASIPEKLVAESFIRKHHVLPLRKRGPRLFIAMEDPTNLAALDEIKFGTGSNTEAVVVESLKLKAAVEKYLSGSDDSAFQGLDDDLDNLDITGGEEDKKDDDAGSGTDDAPIVKFVNKVLLDAIKGGSSDLHFEPYEKTYRVRFRTDGILHEVQRLPSNVAGKIAARLKVMAQLNIAERRVPQDGRIKLKISKTRAIDFRVNTCPTLFGEKVVMRILDPESAKLGIDMLGYEPEQKKMYLDALNKPQGMILITGPTGSGKTVSLYTGINILNTPERNISTAEDPVEINLEGVNQVNVNAAQGMDFSAALKAFLRQDPDIILVGEIRDLETGSIAIKAAQTGHMVLSTLHTNSAPETLTRLRNMGVPAFNIATSVNLIIAQRLARRLCEKCKTPVEVTREALLEMGFTEDDLKKEFTIFGPKGCPNCKGGYKGRVGIYEVVKITDSISRLIMEDANSIVIADECRRLGFNNIHRSGLVKVMSGLTSLEEVDRVTSGH